MEISLDTAEKKREHRGKASYDSSTFRLCYKQIFFGCENTIIDLRKMLFYGLWIGSFFMIICWMLYWSCRRGGLSERSERVQTMKRRVALVYWIFILNLSRRVSQLKSERASTRANQSSDHQPLRSQLNSCSHISIPHWNSPPQPLVDFSLDQRNVSTGTEHRSTLKSNK